jgi:hypothetical protein
MRHVDLHTAANYVGTTIQSMSVLSTHGMKYHRSKIKRGLYDLDIIDEIHHNIEITIDMAMMLTYYKLEDMKLSELSRYIGISRAKVENITYKTAMLIINKLQDELEAFRESEYNYYNILEKYENIKEK